MFKNKIQTSLGSKISTFIIYSSLFLIGLLTLYPFWDALVVSISTYADYLSKSIHLWPGEMTFGAYKEILKLSPLWTAFLNSIFVTLVGTFINMLVTIMTAYVLSKTFLKGQRIIMFFIVFTMMFSGGMIPSYIVVKNLGLMDSLWALILPGVVSTYNLVILRNFFSALPRSIEESAMIDGCSDVGILFKIVIPISKPAIATVSLFYAVAHWNEFFSAVMYIYNKEKWTLQLFLRSILFENDMAYMTGGDSLYLMGEPAKMAGVVIAIIPIVILFLVCQKYLVQGATVGAVKG